MKSVFAYSVILAVSAFLAGCGSEVEPPEIHNTDKTKVNLLSVADFKRGNWREGTGDYAVKVASDDGRRLRVDGVILANGSGGSQPGRLIIGDGTAAFAVDMASADAAAVYAVGQKIELSVEGLYAGRRGSVFMLGEGSGLSAFSSGRFAGAMKLTGDADASNAAAVAMPLSLLEGDDALLLWQSRLVRLDHVSFKSKTDYGFILEEANGATISMVMADSDDFGWDGATEGEGSVTGIVSTMVSGDDLKWIIMPRSGEDFSGFNVKNDPPGDNGDDGGGDTGDNPSDAPDAADDAENMADLSTLNDGKNVAGYSGTYVSKKGWTARNCAIASGGDEDNPSENVFAFMGGGRGPVLNGRMGGEGSLTSPVLSGGIRRLEFSYGFPFEERKARFTVNILRDGEVMLSTSVALENIESRREYSFGWDVEADGEFVIEILNDGYSASSGDKDRLAIWNLRWEPAPEE